MVSYVPHSSATVVGVERKEVIAAYFISKRAYGQGYPSTCQHTVTDCYITNNLQIGE